jgi:sulfite exporter TauE/SafE
LLNRVNMGDFLGSIDNVAAATGFLAAAVVGLTSSLHCFLMCGPLACASAPIAPGAGPIERLPAIAAYQLSRLVAYATVGGALGLLGSGVAGALRVEVRPAVPWVMAAVLVISALGLGKKLGSLPGVGRAIGRIASLASRLAPTARASLIGAMTPLLPCGLLYGVVAAALAVGSPGGGLSVLAGFAAGSAPALLAAQLQLGLLRRLGRVPLLLIERGLPLAVAGLIVYRALHAAGAAASCCH